MSGKAITDRTDAAEPPRRDRRAERREATRTEILEAAWDLVREHGLTELSLRDLGDRVGMRAQSLYSYFDSKHAIYDAMFKQGNEEFLRRVEVVRDTAGTAEERFRLGARAFVDFALEDAARAQLLFVRIIPGFEPSAESYAPAVRVLELEQERLHELGFTDPALLDIWTAMIGGLVQQQISNDPGGNRWSRRLDDVIDMFLAYARKRKSR
jgi:AcrR family transcriptional regulator